MKVWRAERAGQFGRGSPLSRFNLSGMTFFYTLCALAFGYFLWTQYGPKPIVETPVAITTTPWPTVESSPTTDPNTTPTETPTATPTETPTPTATGILPTVAMPFLFTTQPSRTPGQIDFPTPTPGPSPTPGPVGLLPTPAVVIVKATTVVRVVVTQIVRVVETVQVPVTVVVEVPAQPGPTQTPWVVVVTATPPFTQSVQPYNVFIPFVRR